MIEPATPRIVLPRVRVIWIWTMIGLFLIICGFAWYIFDQVVQLVDIAILTAFPEESTNTTMSFILSIWNNLLPISLFGLGIWVFVKSQKRPEEMQG